MTRSRTRTVLLATTGAVLLGGAALAATGFGGEGLFGDGNNAAAARSTLPPATATVDRTTLTETEDVDGTLGYGDPRTVSGAGAGTLTWLAPEGATVTRGRPLYKVDTRPVPVLYGSLPFYRTLRSGVAGADVRQLEGNLQALGYTGFTVDDDYTSGTAAAVRAWQEDRGVSETGTVDRGEVVVAPGPVRVAEHKKAKGDSAAGPILTCTGTARIVSVDLDVKMQDLAKKGAAVTVELPGGDTTAGRITKVGAVATRPEQESDSATIEVTITVKAQKDLGPYDEAPVEVRLASGKRSGVLAVPVGALLALPDGGYGVQVVEGSAVRDLSVEVGMFASGKVEVSGEGLAAGMKVGIPGE